MRARWLASVAVAVLSAACADTTKVASVPRVGDRPVAAEVAVDSVPATLASLRVAPEDVETLEREAGNESWLSDTKLWSLRAGDRLRATLQISRFVPDAAAEEDDFREKIVAQVGTTAARPRTLGGRRVYVTSGNQQLVYVWFRSRSLCVLSVATDFDEPRTLLRAALEVEP